MLLVPVLAAVTLSVSDRTGADLNYIPERDEHTVDVGTSPSVALTVTSKRSTFDVSYGPSFGWIDVTDDPEFVMQHSVGAGYAWGTRRLRISLSLGGSYGRVSYLSAVAAAAPVTAQPGDGNANMGGPPAPGPPGPAPGPPTEAPVAELLPQVSVLEVASAGVSLNVGYAISRRWGLLLGTGFSMGGGLGGSQEYLPFRYGPFASAGVGYQITERDTLTSTLSGSVDILPEQDGRFQTVTLLETWTHVFTPLAVSTLGAGATYVRARESPDAKKTRSVNAEALASFWKGFKLAGGAMLGVTTSANLTTGYNPVLGEVSQTVNGSVGADWSRKRLTLNAGVQASQSLPPDAPDAFRSYGASAGMSYQLSEPISLDAGGYWLHQVAPPTGAPVAINPDRWGVSLGVTIAAPPIRL